MSVAADTAEAGAPVEDAADAAPAPVKLSGEAREVALADAPSNAP